MFNPPEGVTGVFLLILGPMSQVLTAVRATIGKHRAAARLKGVKKEGGQ